jgi:hypothetical protein
MVSKVPSLNTLTNMWQIFMFTTNDYDLVLFPLTSYRSITQMFLVM